MKMTVMVKTKCVWNVRNNKTVLQLTSNIHKGYVLANWCECGDQISIGKVESGDMHWQIIESEEVNCINLVEHECIIITYYKGQTP